MTDLRSKGLIFILSSPSGCGKSTIARKLKQLIANTWLSVSVTTRAPRVGEINGHDYHFMDIADFNKMRDQFLECTEIYGNFYGTLKSYAFDNLNKGIDVLLDIDFDGAKTLKTLDLGVEVVTVFLLPPSFKELENRLVKRGDVAESIRKRLSQAKEDCNQALVYDYVVINDNFDQTFNIISSILIAHRHKTRYSSKLDEFIFNL